MSAFRSITISIHFQLSIGEFKANGSNQNAIGGSFINGSGQKRNGKRRVIRVHKFHSSFMSSLNRIQPMVAVGDDDVGSCAISEAETMDPELRTELKLKPGQFVQFFLFRLFSVFALSPGLWRAVCVFGFMPAISPHTAHNHSHIICKDFCIYCQRFQGFAWLPNPNRDPIPIPIRIWLQQLS